MRHIITRGHQTRRRTPSTCRRPPGEPAQQHTAPRAGCPCRCCASCRPCSHTICKGTQSVQPHAVQPHTGTITRRYNRMQYNRTPYNRTQVQSHAVQSHAVQSHAGDTPVRLSAATPPLVSAHVCRQQAHRCLDGMPCEQAAAATYRRSPTNRPLSGVALEASASCSSNQARLQQQQHRRTAEGSGQRVNHLASSRLPVLNE